MIVRLQSVGFEGMSLLLYQLTLELHELQGTKQCLHYHPPNTNTYFDLTVLQ
jgi:hypothetical protein